MGKKLKMNVTSVLIMMLAALFMAGPISSVQAGSADKLKARIEELKRKKTRLKREKEKRVEKSRPTGDKLRVIIKRYEKLLDKCAAKKSHRCADVMITLGGLYYDLGKEQYARKLDRHNEELEAYDRRPVGDPPQQPVPDYSKALAMWWRLDKEYPKFPKLAQAYYQMGNTYLVQGDMDSTKIVFERLVERFPNHPYASGAHFRLSDLAFLNHNMTQAKKHLSKVKKDEVPLQTWEMAHYRKAEVEYNMGGFDKAVEYFYSYVEACDNNEYQKKEFREEALEYMAIAFSDMPDGGEKAVKFFRKVGRKNYEAQVLYTVGMKNRTHGQYDAAIKSLGTALKSFPYYKDAPQARQMLVECYVVKKEHEKANAERVRLVDDYGKGSKWFEKNKHRKVEIAKAEKEVQRALGSIAIYFHAMAQKKKDRSLYEKAKERYTEYFTRFPDDKWKVYEFKYNVAEIYSSMGDYAKAAENYDYVAMQDLSTYPKYKEDVDTLGWDPEEAEKEKAKAGNKTNPVEISQEDAGYNAIVAFDKLRKKDRAKEGLDEKKAYSLSSTKKLLDYTVKFQKRFPESSNAPEVLYLGGNIHYSAEAYDEAISVFKQIADEYPDAKITPKATRMLANSYSKDGQFKLAENTYNRLLANTSEDSKEYGEVLDLAAGSMFREAEEIKEKGDMVAAAEAFKAIANSYAESKVADRGWFQAGVCYEEAKDLESAAQTFEELTVKFPKSKLREDAFIRSAKNFKKDKQHERAAEVYLTAANTIPEADFAIPSLSSASECYQELEQFDMAGKMFELIYERYADDPKTPQALYNAGLIFEKGKLYPNAINVYEALAERYPDNQYAAEAFFSIGICYEKLEEFEKMAGVFSEYADKFTDDKYKQVQALVKAGDAYYNMEKLSVAEKNYKKAIKVYEEYGETNDIDVDDVGQAYYMTGEIYYDRFMDIKLDAPNENAMGNQVKKKTEALAEPAKYYAKAIELGLQEWTVRGTYMIGKAFYDMSKAVEDQKLFGNEYEQVAGKIKVLSSLEKYYDKAMEYFYQNITWAKEQNIKGEYIEKSMDALMEMAYLKGQIFEQVGITFKESPIPPELSGEEKEIYKLELEDRWLKSQEASVPKYEHGIQVAADIGIANSPWVEKMRERLSDIDPASEYVDMEIEEWKLDKTPQKIEGEDGELVEAKPVDEVFEKNMARIENIMNMKISFEEKIRQLNRIKMEADRNIVLEKEKLERLKEKSGT
ncbi:MAG: tetratricopeptide repeat protein [Chitinispirillaceae bacterium]